MEKCSVCKKSGIHFACSSCEIVSYCSLKCAGQDFIASHLHAEHDADLIAALANVYIGSINSLSNPAVMLKVDAVLSVLRTSKSERNGKISTRYLRKLVKQWPNVQEHLHVSIYDEPDAPIEKHFDVMADFIYSHAKQGHTVLVHCHAGMSRSVTAVLYYMMKYKGYTSVSDALAVIRKSRPVANPNSGFIKKLNKVF
ncbi:MAG: dual specificity protein phosphatase family protein [Nitrosomonas sp.]|nr:dual specificity protein phosphatase family protein [Nitrosomonas sp.]